jgi:uncharacterized membrane protein
MNIPKPYAAAIAAIGAAITAAVVYYPQFAPFSVAIGAIIQALVGNAAHNALPPGKS